MIITEPNWKSYLVQTITPIFTPEQCEIISNLVDLCHHRMQK